MQMWSIIISIIFSVIEPFIFFPQEVANMAFSKNWNLFMAFALNYTSSLPS